MEESKKNNHEKLKQASKKAKSFYEELLNLQWERLKMFKMSEKKQADFQQDRLEKQLEIEAKKIPWIFLRVWENVEKWKINR